MLGTTNASSKSGGSTETITITASLASGCDFGIIVGGTPITYSGTYTVPKYSLCTIGSQEFFTWVSGDKPSSHTVTRTIKLFGTVVASPMFSDWYFKLRNNYASVYYEGSVYTADTFAPFSTTFEVASNIKIIVTGTGTAGKLTVTNS